MKYVLKFSELVELEGSQLELELESLEKWLHNSGIDPEFDRTEHVYRDDETGDRWIFLPELTKAQHLALELILSSSEVYADTKPVRRGPGTTAFIGTEDGN